MKNYIKTITLLLLSSIFISSSCKKNTPANTEELLPPETQTGAFTFGCKVEGKIYTAKGKGGLLSNQSMFYNIIASDSAINIGISNTKQNFSLDMTIKYTGNAPYYVMKRYDYNAIFQDNSNGSIPGNSNAYYTDSIYTGKVYIKFFNGSLNPVHPGNILAGTFEMDAKNANGKVIKITEGRFDIGF
jgi:hypothetical protein